MELKELLKYLESVGSAQHRKIYANHGIKEEMYGVSYAHLTPLKKKIKIDHELAIQLWETGNHDARILALMIADPNKATSKLLDDWSKDLTNYVIMDAFSGYAGATTLIQKKFEQWNTSKNEWVESAAWRLFAQLASQQNDLPDSYFLQQLEIIEKKIHSMKNRVKHSMNSAIIQIGARNTTLEKAAVAAAKRIGKLEVDHGKTDCKTPDAIEYIQKMKKRKKGK